MNDARFSYAASFVTKSLGLIEGSLLPQDLPSQLVDDICSATRGLSSKDETEPYIEKQLTSFSVGLQESDLERYGVHLRKARWPDGRRYALCLTHDVDNIERPLKHLWETRSRFRTADLLLALLGVRSVYNNIDVIAKTERNRKLRSSFYFLTSNYSLKEMQETTKDLAENGWDLGLHGDFGTHDSAQKMRESVDAFSGAMGFPPRGIRQHYLKFSFDKTWEIMESIGFDYDSSVGLNDRLGFKLGLATPFHPPRGDWSEMNILELPLTLMDTTLWGYLKLTEEDGLRATKQLLSSVEAVEGLFTLLWHQEAIRMKGGRLYWKILDDMSKGDCFIADGIGISRWWRLRSAARLLRQGKRVLGEEWPRGLCLRAKFAEGVSVNHLNCTTKTDGDFKRIIVKGSGFGLEVS